MGKFVALEGVDAVGKSTQIALMKKCLKSRGIRYKFVHFPRTSVRPFGPVIARFLRGEFGTVESVSPYLVALLYAWDRKEAAPIIRSWLKSGYLVLADRYHCSNVAFQSAKIVGAGGKARFRKWIKHIEITCFRIPVPDVSILLHLPVDILEPRLLAKSQEVRRPYLRGMTDIHEASVTLQRAVEKEYLKLADSDPSIAVASCWSNDCGILPPRAIHAQIVEMLTTRGIL